MNRTRAHHLDWLSLVDVDGQFLSLPVIRRAFPAGLDEVPGKDRAGARERLERVAERPGNETRAAWIAWLLRDLLGWGDRYVVESQALKTFEIPEYRTTLNASGALIDPADGRVRLVTLRVPYQARFDTRLNGATWNGSPIERATLIARANDVPIALVEDGERVAILNVPKDGTVGHAVWHTDLFAEGAERTLFASFVSLLHARRFFNVMPKHELSAMFEASALEGSELTKTLGFQVRRAVELFVAALSSVDRDDRRRQGRGLLAGVPPHEVYVAAATVMMRVIFLLYAEERGLLPLEEPLYAQSYALSTLREQIERERLESGNEPLERRSSAWRRILATFAAIHDGVAHDRLRTIAYGGRLFDPRRFPFLLEARVDDLTVATILRALQVLEADRGGPARRLSFRELDVEQIGHVYESLLDHDARRAEGVVLGFMGKSGDEPEIDLTALEAASANGHETLVAFLTETTGRAAKAVTRDLDRAAALVRDRDVETTRRIRRACENDVGTAERVLPYSTFLRDDLHGVPTVYLHGSMLVRKTRTRRDSGTEYTPRVLAEEIVRFTLEPLCYRPGPMEGSERDRWLLKHSSELLALKICDPACGSGAFLVATCRYLADRVVEAWSSENGRCDDDAVREARRLIAQRCVYGVDRDGMAVEMAKLSLWLLTFSRERPFGFVDHAIREGDSLLGISSLEQLSNLHHDVSHGIALHSGTLFDATPGIAKLVVEAVVLRRRIASNDVVDVRDAEEKARLQAEASSKLSIARIIADGLVGIELALADRPERERDAAHLMLGTLSKAALGTDADRGEEALASIARDAATRIGAGRPDSSPLRRPFHWALEFPEVFEGSQSGFDAVVGNPPFLGGKLITGRYGTDYRSLLLKTIAGNRRGNADLVAYFVLRAAQVAQRFGLIATNTVSQGDTREVGLDALVSGGWQIVRAERSRRWPGAASIEIAELWCAKKPSNEPLILGDKRVSGISPLLVPLTRVEGNPKRLSTNLRIAFQGSVVLGMGFTMPPEAAARLIEQDKNNGDVIFFYLNGDDVCREPQQRASRSVINFFDWSEDEARKYSAFDVLDRLVRPERQRRNEQGEYVLREPLPTRWWQYADKRPALYRQISELSEVIVIPMVSKFAIPVKVSSRQVFSNQLAVLASNEDGLYGLLTSEAHRAWARSRGSTLETRSRYTPTDCFETFPMPENLSSLAESMHSLHKHRAALMVDRQQGITLTYNRYHDPACNDSDIKTLRHLHAELDRVVFAAYGWTSIDRRRSFRETEEGLRYTIPEDLRIELLDALLELNLSRAGGEPAQAVPLTLPIRAEI